MGTHIYNIQMYIYTYIQYIHSYICIIIYTFEIQKERERGETIKRETEREIEKARHNVIVHYIHSYLLIYM